MVDMSAIAGVLTAIKGSKDIADGMISLRDSAIIAEKVAAINSKLMDAQTGLIKIQQENFELILAIQELQSEVARLNAWKAEKERYELKEVGKGVFVFKLKDQYKNQEPSHYLCTSCLENGKKSILQDSQVEKYDTKVHRCNICDAEYLFGVADRRATLQQAARVHRRDNPFS